MTIAGGVHLLAPDGLVLGGGGPSTPKAFPTPDRTAERTLTDARFTVRHGRIRLNTGGFLSWTLLDRRSGQIIGSANMRAPVSAPAVVRPWLAADHLRRTAARGHTPEQARVRQLRAVLRGNDKGAANALFWELGGDASIRRMVKVCRLADSKPSGGDWSRTHISARDAVRVGTCLSDGRAAGTRWTAWLLDEMRKTGDDVRHMLPGPAAPEVSLNSGALFSDSQRWHVGCLAVDRDWALGVLTRYPRRLGPQHGKRLCGALSRQLLDS